MPSVLVAESLIEEERVMCFACSRHIAICRSRKKVGSGQRSAEATGSLACLCASMREKPRTEDPEEFSQFVEPRTARSARLPGQRFAAGSLHSRRISHRVSTARRHRPAARPNTSVKATRYGMRCKPGVCQFHHRHTPGLQRTPPRAPYLER
jgi:hypothetical protein